MSATTGNDNPSGHAVAAESMTFAMIAIPTTIVVGCAVLATAAPIGVSIIAVFLFAGPHNWLEARYFLTRMPPRWGSLTPYFSIGMIGSLLLTGSFAMLPWLSGNNAQNGLLLIALWNTLLTIWIVWLAMLRSHQNPRRDWPLLIPIGLGLIGVNWISPLAWSLALVYLHPLMALVFLDREMQKRPIAWRKSFRFGVLLIPACLLLMAARMASGPDIPANDLLTWQITHHAGSSVIARVSTHFLVAAHVFLELLHYLVWIVMVPLMNRKISLRQTLNVPLARRSVYWRRIIIAGITVGALAMLVLWASFLIDYSWTRDVYFTIAILHVLIEIPFLLRSL